MCPRAENANRPANRTLPMSRIAPARVVMTTVSGRNLQDDAPAAVAAFGNGMCLGRVGEGKNRSELWSQRPRLDELRELLQHRPRHFWRLHTGRAHTMCCRLLR